MKKFVLAGLCAIAVTAMVQQPASAWINSRFGVGLNWDFQSGGNNFGWGAWRNGQPPGPESFGGGGYGHGHHHNQFPQFFPPAHSHGYAPMPQPQSPQGSFGMQTNEPPYAGQYASPYQFANYPRPVYYYYPAPYYYYGR